MRKRDLVLIVTALVLAVTISIHILLGQTVQTGAWGLSFRTPGDAPVAPSSAAQLAKYDAAYLDPSGDKVIYLTFDAGYENGCTAKILDTLKKHDISAAFFLVGHYIRENPDLVRRMVAEGHTVGNHTMHHPDMSKLTNEADFAAELTALEELYLQVTGENMPKFYRPPQGNYSEKNLEFSKNMGYKTVFWSLAYVDWNNDAQPSAESAMNTLLSRIHPGAVVLLHSTSATNAEILDALLTKWKEMGYEFRPIHSLFPS